MHLVSSATAHKPTGMAVSITFVIIEAGSVLANRCSGTVSWRRDHIPMYRFVDRETERKLSLRVIYVLLSWISGIYMNKTEL